MAQLHLVLGPVGAGKSTFALGLCQQHSALRLNLDEWMVTLFRADRPSEGVMTWYAERTKRCLEQIWLIASRTVAAGANVVLEVGLLQCAARQSFYRQIDEAGLSLQVYVLSASRELRRRRIEARNAAQGETFSMVVPPEVFELASDMWQPPDEAERKERAMVLIDTELSGS